MIRFLKAFFIRKRFERAFAAELRRVAVQRKRHAKVKPTQAELQTRLHDALRGSSRDHARSLRRAG